MPRTERASRPKRRRRTERQLLFAALAVVSALIVLVDAPVLSAQAIAFDDASFIEWNPIICRPSLESVRRAFVEVSQPSTVRGYYIPLTMTSLMLDFALGGRPNDLFVFHLTNLALHLGTALLFFVVLYESFERLIPAALVSLVFALHPLTVEPVAWVAERKTLLAAFFALASMASYVSGVRRPARMRPLLLASFVAYVCAVLSKPTAMPLPFLLLLLDVWPFRRFGMRAFVEKLPFIGVAVVSAVVTYRSQAVSAGLPVEAANAPSVWLVLTHNAGFYFEKLFWPVDLTSVYPRPTPFAWHEKSVFMRLLLVAFALAAVLLSWRRTRAPAVALAFFAIALAPTLGIVEFSWVTVSDKYAYLPMLGPLLLLAGALAWAWGPSRPLALKGSRRVLVSGIGLVLVALALRTRSQLGYWRDSETLQRQLVALAPDSFNAHAVLGNTLLAKGKVDEAFAELTRAHDLNSSHPYTRLYYLHALERRGEFQRAVGGYRELVAQMPDFAEAHWFLGRALATQGSWRAAVVELRAAVGLKPRLGAAHEQLARALYASGDRSAARAALEASLALFPDQPSARQLLEQW